MSSFFHTDHLAAAAALAVLASACAVTPEQPAATADLPPAGADGEYHVKLPAPSPGEARLLEMTVSEDVSAKCTLEPHFHFDEAKPRAQGYEKIQALAGCLNDPAVRDHDVALIGRADERGSDAYNMNLAKERALKVKNLLIEHGVAGARLHVSVRGESGAKQGDGLHSHGFDRRVDVELMNVTHAPVESEVSPTMAPQRGGQ